MSNVAALFEGPYWAKDVEQIAQSTSGRWFSRTTHRGRMGQWKEIAGPPRRLCMTDDVYGPWSEPIPKEELGPFVISGYRWSSWRSPTEDECASCVKGATSGLMPKTGPHTLRLPMSQSERVALREQKALFIVISRGRRSTASRQASSRSL